MASSSKTPLLGLNQWVASDIPGMADFNSDNLAVEQQLGAHMANEELHLTAALKNRLSSLFTAGSYVGNNGASRTVELGFRPTLVLLFAQDQPLVHALSGGNYVYSAMIGPDGATTGAEMTQTGFTVYQVNTMPPTGDAPKLNMSGTTYRYLAIR